MKLKYLSAANYRTLEEIELAFPNFYTAICGKNNSGKSNVIRVIRHFLGGDDPFGFDDRVQIDHESDLTAWNKAGATAEIRLKIQLELDPVTDRGLVEFIERLGNVKQSDGEHKIALVLENTFGDKKRPKSSTATFGTEKLDEVGTQELLKKLKSSSALIFHNSTSASRPVFYSRKGRMHGLLQKLSDEDKTALSKKKAALTREIEKLLETQESQLTSLLGRLEERYKVKLTTPEFDFEQWPFGISLGDKEFDVPLDDWGSGTRNRTLILKSIFEAKQAASNSVVSEKITPLVIVEEPESFLHPLAQAKFGTILEELTSELQIQVIATTHSPYLLSHSDPSCNLLLERHSGDGKLLRGSKCISTLGPNWRKPFDHALGVSGPDFDIFRDAVFSKSNTLIMVEGDTDKAYLDLCRNPAHGASALCDQGEIFAYGGYGSLTNTLLMKFIKERFKNVVVTFDLDAEKTVRNALEAVGFKKDATYFAIGINAPGARCIEGLLPSEVKQAVRTSRPELVDALSSDDREEAKKARDELKRLYLDEFKNSATPGERHYGELYKLCKKLNRAIERNS